MSRTNPDSRALPEGWVTQYDDNHGAWFYIDTKAHPPTPTWIHPLGPPPANLSHPEPPTPHKQSSHSPTGSVTYAAAPVEPKNPDTRPVPVGWVTQYNETYKAWFYINTSVNPITPSWVHPLGPPPSSPPPVHSQAAAPPQASSPPPANPAEPENPDRRPLPAGWTQQYDLNHNTFFYVDTTATLPTPTWVHPLGPAPASSWPPQAGAAPSPAPAPAPAKVASPPPPQPAAPGEPENPDKRALPTGWVQQYETNHRAFFYVDTTAPNPTPTWTHPLGPPPTPVATSGQVSPVHPKVASPLPQPATPGQPENPDKRPLPAGWVQQYEPSHKAFFYVDTTAPNPSPTWTHPFGAPTVSPVPGPGTQGSSTTPPVSHTPGQPINPDKRPLPAGWIDQYDASHQVWFYVDTKAPTPTPTWIHPHGPPPTSPTPTTTSTSGPSTTPAPTGPQNPDARALPPGWVTEYDAARSIWFYVDTTKNPPASTWTHPLGPPQPGYSGAPAPAPAAAPSYGQPASYGGSGSGSGSGAAQHKPPGGGLLGGLLGGKTAGKAGKYLGSQLQGLAGKHAAAAGSQALPAQGSWPGQPQPPYGEPAPQQGQYPPRY